MSLRADNLFDLTFIADVQLSPDGHRVAAVHTTIHKPEEEEDKSDKTPDKTKGKPPRYRSRIHLYDLETDTSRVFTQSPLSDSQPRFSPDGTQLAFVSKRQEEDKPQLYLISLGGGEARQLTRLKAGVGEVAWHPGGRRLAFVSRGDVEDERSKQGRARVIERMSYKLDGRGFKPDEVAQIYLYDLETDQHTRLTELKSDPSGVAFGPGGDIYYSGAKDLDAADRWESNLWRVPTTGGESQPLVSNLSRAANPVPSPDGAYIAFVASVLDDNFASATGVWLVASNGGEARLVSGDLDTGQSIGGDSRYGALPDGPRWADDSQSLYVCVNHDGRSGVTQLSLTGGVYPLQDGPRAVTSFHHAAGRIVFTAETPTTPAELFVLWNGKERQLSQVNHGFCDTHPLTPVSGPHPAQAEGGPPLSYWTLQPATPRDDNALVVQVHGGPHANYGYGFSFEFQLLAARGYTVVFGNPRGSSGYGTDFATAMLGGYGTLDADDVLAIAKSARARHSDPDAPMHLTGGSYGGFMTNWLVGHSDMFRSAVTQRSICNWLSFYGTSDIGYRFSEQEVAGTPWDDLDKLWTQSPLAYVKNITTPLLIIHAEEDHRCPIEQAEQLFIALKRLGKAPTRLIRFPDEGHELSRSGRPDRRLERLTAIIDWFETHA